jgi:aminoglycoside phosphotransferase (APT) family kinase protein
VPVHGDVLPHNLLADDGRVTALLDWEFVHVGDPAEDLAYCRPAVAAVMPWSEFMQRYDDAGGQKVDERRLAIFGLWGLVRNC